MFRARDCAVVIGAGGGLGAAIADRLESGGEYAAVLRLGRRTQPALDVTSETDWIAAARHVEASGLAPRLVLVATGFLHDERFRPEKALRELDPAQLAQSFAVNAIGPALAMKHLLPLLPREGRSVFAALSAKVGSIGDNRLGGWFAYRAAKAALNQLVHTAALELRRTRPDAICIVLHPGTVDTPLSRPFARAGLNVRAPDAAAREILGALATLGVSASGGFYDYAGREIVW